VRGDERLGFRGEFQVTDEDPGSAGVGELGKSKTDAWALQSMREDTHVVNENEEWVGLGHSVTTESIGGDGLFVSPARPFTNGAGRKWDVVSSHSRRAQHSMTAREGQMRVVEEIGST
jgi:hypothetical protein